MDDKRPKNNDLTLLLLQESLWAIEDKIKVIAETIFDHEAEVIRLKRLNQLFAERLSTLEINKTMTSTESNDRPKQTHKS